MVFDWSIWNHSKNSIFSTDGYRLYARSSCANKLFWCRVLFKPIRVCLIYIYCIYIYDIIPTQSWTSMFPQWPYNLRALVYQRGNKWLESQTRFFFQMLLDIDDFCNAENLSFEMAVEISRNFAAFQKHIVPYFFNPKTVFLQTSKVLQILSWAKYWIYLENLCDHSYTDTFVFQILNKY